MKKRELVSKSRFKAHALEYFRQVEKTGGELIITDKGKPVLRLLPYTHDPAEALAELRGSVKRYDDPTEPIALDEWASLK